MDVRAPVEFNEGAFPAANNIPLINDEERHVIGKTYKDLGQDEAIKLGVELVSGTTKSDRLAQWQQFTQTHPARRALLLPRRHAIKSHSAVAI